ncbi:MAG: hypothetical protein HY666_00710 [Chloroflexi bacterium]|nr:hypothetical protein [Chloroflexota bacterium]
MRFFLFLLLVLTLLYPSVKISSQESVAASPLTVIVLDLQATSSDSSVSGLAKSTLGLLSALHPNPQIAFIPFSSTATLQGPVSSQGQDVNSIRAYLYGEMDSALHRNGGANLADALTEAYNLLSAQRATEGSAIYLMSWGLPSPETAAQQAQVRSLLKLFVQKGWALNSVSLLNTPPDGGQFLSTIASSTGGEVIDASSATALKRIADNLLMSSARGSLSPVGEGNSTTWDILSLEMPIVPRTQDVELMFFREDVSSRLRLLNGSGQETRPGDAALAEFIETPHFVLWKLKNPQPGSWQMQVQRTKGRVFTWQKSDNPLNLVLNAPTISPLNEPTVITASATERGQLLHPSDVRFLAQVASPQGGVNTYELNDMGEKGDKVAGDGYFSVRIPSLAQQGDYRIKLELAWPSFNSRVSSLHQFQVAPFPQVTVEPIQTNELKPGVETRIANVIVNVQGAPYAVSAGNLIPQVVSDSGASAPATVRTEQILDEGQASSYYVTYTPEEPGRHIFSLQLRLDYLGREYIYSSQSLVLDVPAPLPAPSSPSTPAFPASVVSLIPSQEGVPIWAIPASVLAISVILWILFWFLRTRPYGYLYGETNQEVANFSAVKRSLLGTLLFKSSIRGKELGVSTLEGATFRFSRRGVRLTYSKPSPTLRVNNYPIVGTASLGEKAWIGTQGKLYTFLTRSTLSSAPAFSGGDG